VPAVDAAAAAAAAAAGAVPAALAAGASASPGRGGETGVLGDGSDRGLVEATGTTDGTHISANAQLRGSDGDRWVFLPNSSSGMDLLSLSAGVAVVILAGWRYVNW
jgi:hypothetical protein